ncbi:MAG TPA: ketopantoate reductase family protein [Clostridiales bacterium]|jgi:2-dehydropantoate 2-reductase|nr:ketopantoate reductase family protein [Clostridiales bacterium]HRT81907.1 ketopantoate reductase family protein [Oscillospiraceae bacterium]
MEERKEIKTVAIIGLGALGILIGNKLAKSMPKEDLRIVADQKRIEKYKSEGVYDMGELCDFNYVSSDEKTEPADLVIFAVKFNALPDALEAVKNQVGENTLFLSILNGISSEEFIAGAYSPQQVIYAVAQGMDAVKEGNKLTYLNRGTVFFGDDTSGKKKELVERVERFFKRVNLPHEKVDDIKRRIWNKFMLNVGINQTLAVFGNTYIDAQSPGKTQDVMLAAMREVIPLARKEGVNLSEDDIPYWLGIINTLNPEGKPSMRQDVEAKRPSELEMLGGTVLALGKKHGIETPVNKMLYERLKEIEAAY